MYRNGHAESLCWPTTPAPSLPQPSPAGMLRASAGWFLQKPASSQGTCAPPWGSLPRRLLRRQLPKTGNEGDVFQGCTPSSFLTLGDNLHYFLITYIKYACLLVQIFWIVQKFTQCNMKALFHLTLIPLTSLNIFLINILIYTCKYISWIFSHRSGIMQSVHLFNLSYSVSIAILCPRHFWFHEKAQILMSLSGLAVYVYSFLSRTGKYLM